ncbi:FAD binding domain protein [Aspergillus sclerotiicarbonarius CBS 121057]|uniref:FAD binding domain protein n=1 Tax=Aspergillus sclerotiicarbonarius (strain CBS 121057 / IBT 28362) TaxID=1448318 RepID=A0A319EG59_ASPSB|nr:FAD binding domain protein [Aspergillus sclerotiicarbonarius CBS 121057]
MALGATDQFDVVIIGAGPAGLMAAVWLAQTGVKTLIIEKKLRRTLTGHADGLESRTFEILNSFGLGESIWMESNRTVDVCLWSSSEGGLQRDCVSPNHNPGWSRFQEATLGQGRIEKHLLNFVKRHENVKIEWATVPTSLDISKDKTETPGFYPIGVRIKSSNLEADEQTEAEPERMIQTKYLIGCDGAHSWVRKRLGLVSEGDRTPDGHWGVIDCIPITNFPDIRKRCIIKSGGGNLMIIPREKKLVRFYIQISPAVAASFKANYCPSALMAVLKNILQPYTFDTCHIEWSTIYTVGRRVCNTFSVKNRIFLAGDAVHTHSPKAGQGMNVSMQDTYNLGWKLSSVLMGVATPEILSTYQTERLPVAERLIAFDRRMCSEICSKTKGKISDSSSDKFAGLRLTLSEENTCASGLGVIYGPGLLVTSTDNEDPIPCADKMHLCCPHSKPHLARNIIVGGRLSSQTVLCQSDSRPWHLQDRLVSTGQWHLIIFGADITDITQKARVERLTEILSHPKSLINRIGLPDGSPVGSVATYMIHSAPRKEVEFMDLPPILRPFDNKTGYDYSRVFADNTVGEEGCGCAYQNYGIAPEGCMVLVRPDQHVAFIGALEDTDALYEFLAKFLVTRPVPTKMNYLGAVFSLLVAANGVFATQAAYGVCQAGCSAVVVSCYAAGGSVFGVVPAVAASPAILACNSSYGTCQVACASLLLAPAP